MGGVDGIGGWGRWDWWVGRRGLVGGVDGTGGWGGGDWWVGRRGLVERGSTAGRAGCFKTGYIGVLVSVQIEPAVMHLHITSSSCRHRQ